MLQFPFHYETKSVWRGEGGKHAQIALYLQMRIMLGGIVVIH